MEETLITNYSVLQKYESTGKRLCIEWLILNNSIPEQPEPSKRAYEHAFKNILKARATFRKNKNKPNNFEKMQLFLQTKFEMPRAATRRIPKESIGGLENTPQLQALQDISMELNTSNQLLQQKQDELHDMTEKHTSMQDTNFKLQTKLTNKVQDLKRTASREHYLRQKISRIEMKTDTSEEPEMNTHMEASQSQDELLTTIEKQQKEIKDLMDENIYLRLLIEDNNSKEVSVFDEHRNVYSLELRNCVYSLLQNNVSASEVGPVIDTVLKIVDMKVNKLPSRSTVLNMNIQRLALAQKQLSDEFSTKQNTTLLTDETSKFGKKYMGYEAADADGNLWVLGLREIETKSAHNTLTVLKELLHDIDDCNDAQENSVSNNIIKHIVATMSDRAATEVKFNEVLETWRHTEKIFCLLLFQTTTSSHLNSKAP